MKDLVIFIAQKILNHPEVLSVEENVAENGDTTMILYTHPDDVGLAIGKGGKTANSIREILKVSVTGTGKRLYFDIKPLPDSEATPVNQ